MSKKSKPRKSGMPKKGRKNEVFVPKRETENRHPTMQKMSARGASRPSGHSPKKK